MKPITSATEWYRLLASSPKTIVVYQSSKCVSCKEQEEWLQNKYPNQEIYSICTEDDRTLSFRSNISALPTVEIYQYYQCTDSWDGFQPDRFRTYCK
jgi:hypothetical protein